MPRTSPFPPAPLDETLLIAKTIWEHNAGKPMRRLTIFDALKRSPDSGTSRTLITASSSYGLTQGGYQAESLQLTERGLAIVQDNSLQAKIDAVFSIDVFKSFFENYRNSSLPSNAAATDYLIKNGIPEQNARACLDVILKNGEMLGLIREISGSKRVVSVDYVLEKNSANGGKVSTTNQTAQSPQSAAEILPRTELNPDIPNTSTKNSQIPSLHIDIQIHIAADAKPEQIDQIFASMAKHLYNKN